MIDNMNKKAFTIVELLAIIIILGLLTTITFPVIGNIISNSKKNLYNEQVNKIIEASKRYSAENVFSLPQDNQKLYITILQLQLNGYLKKDSIINPINGEKINGCVEISYLAEGNQYNYKYINECDSNKPIFSYEGDTTIKVQVNESLNLEEI